jgi:drug/metabolite transporter (DMT)-like permease
MDNKKIGVISIIFADIMWAIEPIFAKLAYKDADVLQTATIRAIFVALTALPYIFITNRGNFRINRKQFGVLVYIAIAGTIIADMLYLIALAKIPIVNALLIGHLQPIFIIVIGFLVLREERLAKFDYLGVLVMMIAALLVTTKTLEKSNITEIGNFWRPYCPLRNCGMGDYCNRCEKIYKRYECRSYGFLSLHDGWNYINRLFPA